MLDDSDFQMKSSARFPERHATHSLKMKQSNQNKNTQRSRKTWIKVFDPRRAEQSEVRKLEEIPEHELDGVLYRFYAADIYKKGLIRELMFKN